MSKNSKINIENLEAGAAQLVSGENIGNVIMNLTTDGPANVTQIFSANPELLLSIKKFEEANLKQASEAIEKGEYERAITLFDNTIGAGLSSTLKRQEKRNLLHYRCCLQLVTDPGTLGSVLQKIATYDPELCDSELYSGWRDLVDYHQGSSKLEFVKAQLPLQNTRPSLFEIALRSDDSEAINIAKRRLLDPPQPLSPEEEKAFGGVYYLLAGICSRQGDLNSGLLAINKMVATSDRDQIRKDTRRFTLTVQEVASKSLASTGLHLDTSDWSTLRRLLEEIDSVIAPAFAADLIEEEAELYSVKSLCLSLLAKHEDAIAVVPQRLHARLSDQALFNLCSSYQHLGDWNRLIRFLETLTANQQAELANVKAIAYLNLNRMEEALDVANLGDEYRTLIECFASDKEWEYVDDKPEEYALFAQYLCNQFLRSGDNAFLAKLLDSTPANNADRLFKANTLIRCDSEAEAFEIYQHVFKSIPPGIGAPFYEYLTGLHKRGYRKELANIFKQYPEGMLFENWGVLSRYLNFLIDTRSPNHLLKSLDKALKHNESLSLKVNWLYTAKMLNLNGQMASRIDEWGLDQDGSTQERLNYYRIVATIVGPDKILPKLYLDFHANPDSFEHLQACFAIVMNGAPGQDGYEPVHLEETSEESFVVLERAGTMRHVLIDFSMSDSVSPWPLKTNDERAENLIGKKKGDKVVFENSEWIVTSIYEKYEWLIAKAFEDLPKRPKQSKVYTFSVEPGEDFAAATLRVIGKESGGSENIAEEAWKDGHFILARLFGSPYDSAWTWLRLIRAELRHRLHLPSNAINQLTNALDNSVFVFDSSSLSNLAIGTKAIQALSVAGCSMAVPHSTIAALKQTASEQSPIAYIASASPEENKEFSENLLLLLSLIESGKIEGVDPVPANDLDDRALSIVRRLPNLDSDPIFAAFGHQDRVLISDDRGLIKLAASLGIRCATSFQLLASASHNLGAGRDFVEPFVSLAMTNLRPIGTPVSVLFHLAIRTDASFAREYLQKNLDEVVYQVNNIEALFDFSALCHREFERSGGQATAAYTEMVAFLLDGLRTKASSEEAFIKFLIRTFKLTRDPSGLGSRYLFPMLRHLNVDTVEFVPYTNEVALNHILQR